MLRGGELRSHERFGPEAVNRGAVLWECEWDGGIFESGVMLGGVFRSGTFRGGVFWAGLWKGGTWSGGLWHNGFGEDGRYRPRGAFPGAALAGARVSPRPLESRATPQATVFTASVHEDVARLWLTCLRRALPQAETAIEIFDDSADGALAMQNFPGVSILRGAPERPDFQIAYNDALTRATTPLLAFADTDVFWVSSGVWPRVRRELGAPNVAAVACVSRSAAESHGTFAVVMRADVYRDVLRNVPDGFAPLVESEVAGGLPGRWRGHDTGDLATRAVRAAGYEVKLLNLEEQGEFVRFDAITNTRLIGGWVGPGLLAEMAVANAYFRRGCLGCFALARLHDRLFPDVPPFAPPISRAEFWSAFSRHPRALARALKDSREFAAGTRRIRRFLADSQGAATTSS